MPITFAKQPETLELAYGKNIVSLYDTDEATLPNVARLYLSGASTHFAEVNQVPNAVGYAHFDLQNILKSKLSYKSDLETITKLATSFDESLEYVIKGGRKSTTGIVQIQASSSVKYVFNGRKDVTAVDWDDSSYIPKLNSGSLAGIPFVTVVSTQKALTDRHIDSVLGSQITDGKPSWLGNNEVVWKINRQPDDAYTLTFLNAWDDFSNGAPAYHNGIAAFRIAIYSGSTELYDNVITNIVSNGGGPNTAASPQIIFPKYPYKAISVQAGDVNALFDTYTTATHYYISTVAWSSENYAAYVDISDIYRFDIDECVGNDFDGVQVSWINSFGFRDYFHFTKRVDNKASITRNTYRQLDASWDSTSITVDSAARGEKVFDQSYSEEYTINTRYLTDAEAAYLKNLYLSPDIRVRFKGQNTWISVIPTTNEWTSRTFRKDKLFQYSLGFKFANPTQLQRG